HLPGEPHVGLHANEIRDYLFRQLHTPVLDDLHDVLWLVGRKSSQHIEPLHRHRQRGRSIVATDDPNLHLVWRHDKVFVKQLPECLLRHQIWQPYLSDEHPGSHPPPLSSNRQSSASAAVPGSSQWCRGAMRGFLRSYALLVRSPLDLQIAIDAMLLPPTASGIGWTEWSRIIDPFRHVPDDDDSVSPRYRFGQLRLSRLNWAVRLFGPPSAETRWFYEIPQSRSIWQNLSAATYPLLYIFASMSLALSSMQVALSTNIEDAHWDTVRSPAMQKVFWIFAILTLCTTGAVWALSLVIPVLVLFWQVVWGF
ncbi:hypothetical protein B0T16DRAFT_295705, partial [Cercophora newfieldiana]